MSKTVHFLNNLYNLCQIFLGWGGFASYFYNYAYIFDTHRIWKWRLPKPVTQTTKNINSQKEIALKQLRHKRKPFSVECWCASQRFQIPVLKKQRRKHVFFPAVPQWVHLYWPIVKLTSVLHWPFQRYREKEEEHVRNRIHCFDAIFFTFQKILSSVQIHTVTHALTQTHTHKFTHSQRSHICHLWAVGCAKLCNPVIFKLGALFFSFAAPPGHKRLSWKVHFHFPGTSGSFKVHSKVLYLFTIRKEHFPWM